MKFLDLHKLTDKELLGNGKLLIAQPFLNDSVFTRSVILLCEHSTEGSLGFVLNKTTDMHLGDLLPEIYDDELEVCQGGPVQLDTLHILHRLPELLGGTELTDNIYWGGSFDELQQQILMNKKPDNNQLKLFLGYSGWSPGQLENELKEGSWLITEPTSELLFNVNSDNIWEAAVNTLGEEYQYLLNLPSNPQLN